MSANDELKGWFAGRIPKDWFTGAPEVRADRDEVWVIGTLPDVELPGDAGPEAANAARSGRIKQYREDTRELRIQISGEAENRFGRKVSWGARCGDSKEMFTHLAVPAMTRLRLPEREVLDALVDSGVARSRAHALAWCVKLVAGKQAEWIGELREALSHVEKARGSGPSAG